MEIDIDFDFTEDARGKDPDIASPMLQTHHQQLWNRALPNDRFSKGYNKMKNAVLEKKELNDKLKMLQSSVWKDYASRDSKGQSLYDLASYGVFGEPYIKLSKSKPCVG